MYAQASVILALVGSVGLNMLDIGEDKTKRNLESWELQVMRMEYEKERGAVLSNANVGKLN